MTQTAKPALLTESEITRCRGYAELNRTESSNLLRMSFVRLELEEVARWWTAAADNPAGPEAELVREMFDEEYADEHDHDQ